MRAMVLDAPRRKLRLEERAEPRSPGPRDVLIRVHACGVCRTDLHVVDGELARPEAAAGARPRDRRHGGRAAARRRAASNRATASACRGSAGPAAFAPIAAAVARISAIAPASPATRSTAAMPTHTVADERVTAFRSRRAIGDVAAAPLLCAGLIGYRALRAGRRRRSARPLRLRRRGAHRRAGRAPPRPARLCLHARRRRDGQEFARWPRRRMGRRLRRDAARAARRRADLRAGRRAGPGRARGDGKGRHGRLRRHPYERHPALSLSAPVGGARRCARSPT